jgi:hypothetical protein
LVFVSLVFTSADYIDLPDLVTIYVTMSVVYWIILFLEVLLMALQDPLRIYEALKGIHVAWWGLRRLYGSPRAFCVLFT